MSRHTSVTVHCDDCGEWVHTTDGFGHSNLQWRQAMGWTTSRTEVGFRLDYCPRCSKTRAETVA